MRFARPGCNLSGKPCRAFEDRFADGSWIAFDLVLHAASIPWLLGCNGGYRQRVRKNDEDEAARRGFFGRRLTSFGFNGREDALHFMAPLGIVLRTGQL